MAHYYYWGYRIFIVFFLITIVLFFVFKLKLTKNKQQKSCITRYRTNKHKQNSTHTYEAVNSKQQCDNVVQQQQQNAIKHIRDKVSERIPKM